MNDQEFLEEYFEICKRIWLDMEANDTWPWETDSPNAVDLVESKNNNNNK